MMGISNLVIGRNIRKALKTLCLTQEKTAELMGLSVLHFGRLERGERPASLEQIARIAQVLEVSTASLLSGCTLDGIFTIPPDDSAEAVAGAIAHLAGGCSPKARKLMLSVCRDIAESDRTVDEES